MAENPKKKIFSLKKTFSFLFGSYTPPGFVLLIIRLFREKRIQKALARGLRALGGWIKGHLLVFVLSLTALLVMGGGYWGWTLWKASQPQPITITYRVERPGVTDYVENKIEPLVLQFKGSAARLEEVDSPTAALIPLEPEIPGSWKWEGDSLLVFTPESPWGIGQEYKVTLPETLFPDHVVVKEPRFEFTIESFKVYMDKPEFYIDPQDSGVKRVLTTLYFNYPVDPESLEGKVNLRPDIKAQSGQLALRDYDYQLTLDEDALKAYIVSEPLGMPASTVKMKISTAKGILSQYGGEAFDQELYQSVSVPGASDFVKVNSLVHELIKNNQQLYDQVLILSTKGDIEDKELMDNIEVWELPKDRPQLPGIKKSQDHRWRNTDEVVPAVLNQALRVEPELIPAERSISSVHSLRFEAQPGRYLYIRLKGGTRFYGNYFLAEDYETILKIKDFPREVAVLSDGSLLSLTGDRQIPVMTRGIRDINVNLSRVRPDDLNHLVSQSNGRLDNLNFRNYRFDEENISVTYRKGLRVGVDNDPRKLNYGAFDLRGYLTNQPEDNLRYGVFLINLQGQRPYHRYNDKRLVVVTDLGFFVKTNTNRTRDLFVQSIATGQPQSGVQVEVWGKNGNPVYRGTTNASGRLTLPSLDGYRNENSPTVYVLTKGGDMSFMPFHDNGQKLEYSNFAVGGVHGAQDPEVIRAFLFSDRGIYRPGDTMNLGMILKAGDWNIDLAGTPLELAITDPRGNEVLTRSIKVGSSGFEEISYKTQDYSPTGLYRGALFVIREDDRREFLGATTMKVEEFLPDALSLSAHIFPSSEGGWIGPEDIQASVTVRNLFGTPAQGSPVTMEMTLSPGYRVFREFRNYHFFDPLLKDKTYTEKLGTFSTNEEGKVETPVDISQFEQATYNLSLHIEAQEKSSGRSVTTQTSVMVSPLEHLVGWKSDGSLSYIRRNSTREVSFLAINRNLNPVAVGDLQLVIKEIRYVSSLIKQPNGVYKYESIEKEYPISSQGVSLPSEGLTTALPTQEGGEFTWSLVDSQGIELSQGRFTVTGDENTQRSLERTAEVEITLNKEDYRPGEWAEVFIKGPYQGAGLITVERDKVYNHIWFDMTGESSTQRIQIPRDLEGNGYISVALVRSLESPEIFMSPLSYGVVPFSVSKDSRTHKIDLDIPALARPGEAYPISFKTNAPGKIIIYAVDQGILQVARYKTPDPIAFFFQKRALEVETQQILDLILPEYSVARGMAAMGGGAGQEALARNLNPFKRKSVEPVAYWSGILDASTDWQQVEYEVPDYFNGTLKVMAVAVSDQRVGAAQEEGIIRSPYVIQPNIPVKAAPGDQLKGSVTITNLNAGSGAGVPLSLKIEGEGALTLAQNEFSLTLDEGADTTVDLDITVGDQPGSGELRFVVSGGGDEAKLSSYMSIRPPVPYQTRVTTGVVQKGADQVDIPFSVYDAFSQREVAASFLPTGMTSGLDLYLANYPYGCSEQITSAAFPVLFDRLYQDLNSQEEKPQSRVNQAISILQARQNSEGGFGVWTQKSSYYPVLDSHIMLFLTQGRNQGYYVPPGMYNRGLIRLKEIAGSRKTDRHSLVARSFAIYLLTVNEIVTTSYIESLEGDLEKNYPKWKNSFAGLFLGGSYSILQQKGEANRVFRAVEREFDSEVDWRYYDPLAYASMYLYMLAQHAPERLPSIGEDLLLDMAGELEREEYTTFSAALALMGINAFLEASPEPAAAKIKVEETLGETTRELVLAPGKLGVTQYSPKADSVTIESDLKQPLFYQVTTAGFDRNPPVETHQGMEVFREYLNEKGDVVSQAELGEMITVRLRVRTTDGSVLSDGAIVDLIPSGFDIDTDSVRLNKSEFRPEYTDLREDRIVLFGTIEGSSREYTYKMRAMTPGQFKVPPSYGEAMYDRKIWSVRPMDDFVIQSR